jgi:hypothetical protein
MGVTSALRETKLTTGGVEAPRSTVCLNCGTALAGPFCSECGQRDVPPYPSLRELVVDAFWELSGWDGRFASTVRALVTKPGRLTLDFLEGRRARFISPLRLYLMASLMYFVVAAAAPELKTADGKPAAIGLRIAPEPTKGTKAEQVANATGKALASQEALSPADRDSILAAVKKAPPIMQPFFQKALLDPKGLRRSLIEAMPKMLFALLPIFAGIVALFYRRRKYPEHLYFAIHLHAFVFIVLTVSALARFTGIVALAGIVSSLTLLSIAAYTTMALRRTYGGSIAGTLAKQVGIGAIYGTISLAAFIATLFAVSRFA